jgi:hypothetical protein
MSTAAAPAHRAQPAAQASKRDSVVDLRLFMVTLVMLSVIYIALRVYQQAFG